MHGSQSVIKANVFILFDESAETRSGIDEPDAAEIQRVPEVVLRAQFPIVEHRKGVMVILLTLPISMCM